jgi:actin-related protein
MADDQISAIVIDNGTGLLKAGLSGQELPSFISDLTTLSNSDSQKPENSHRPIERGIIKDLSAMESIWHNLFQNEMKI